MKFLEGREQYGAALDDAIVRYGYAPEHHAFDYEYAIDSETLNVCGEGASGALLMAKRSGNEWWMMVDPLAPHEYRARLVAEFLESIFKRHSAKKAYLELSEDIRKELLVILSRDLKANKTIYSLEWPVFQLAAFDIELRGNFYKKIRSARNQFLASHAVTEIDATRVAKADLHRVIDGWGRDRKGRDHAFLDYYHAFVNNDFRGTENPTVMIVDNIPRAISAGWTIPNSHTFYEAVSLHDYSHPSLGDVLMTSTLVRLKNNGYKEVNFGGGEKSVTDFKRRFGHARFYTTEYFSVIPKKQ